ncbi:uncharacterized protein LOC122335159 isoform X2 [Puntigrus tetrazona]|uniref:uncharacterized protein LOC122335159 isoform X2 n=1 Tax=Puntigrus tetrazona TaxID=1606681 RepID=UPI001C8A589B|nr:uncharacterized protein LOC122335159 isoform X2 [Puntigrus tetrazona]
MLLETKDDGEVSEHGVSLLRFRMNERIALNCSFTHKTDDIAWYRQSPQSWKTNSAGVCQQHRKKPVYRLLQSPDTYSRHSEENSLASDLCSNRVGRRSLFLWKKCHDFRNAIRKPHQTRDGGSDGIISGREDEDHSDVEISDELTLAERVMVFGGAGLAVLVFFLATVIAGRRIYIHGWQKGWTAAERAGLTLQKPTIFHNNRQDTSVASEQ